MQILVDNGFLQKSCKKEGCICFALPGRERAVDLEVSMLAASSQESHTTPAVRSRLEIGSCKMMNEKLQLGCWPPAMQQGNAARNAEDRTLGFWVNDEQKGASR